MNKKRSFVRILLIGTAVVVAGVSFWFFIRPQYQGECPTLREISSLLSPPSIVLEESPDDQGQFVYPKEDIAKLAELGAVALARANITFIENGSQVNRIGIIGIRSNGEPMNQPEDPTVPPIPPIPGCPPECKCPEEDRVNFSDAKTLLQQLNSLKTITQ